MKSGFRKTAQQIMPVMHQPTKQGVYDIYPAFPIDDGKIHKGYEKLADVIAGQKTVMIDGYIGVLWATFQSSLAKILEKKGLKVNWIDASEYLKAADEIDRVVEPYLGGDDPVFGYKCDLTLSYFFRVDEVSKIFPASGFDINIVYGIGASLAGWDGLLMFIDVPKNEIQFRARAGSISNLGAREPDDPKAMYKRFFFVDWEVLNRYKADLVSSIDWIVDGQRPEEPVFISGSSLKVGLREMSRNYFRVRPWFEPGAWGGQWIKKRIPQLTNDVPNYAWSFELIVPENGLVFESSGCLLEVSFDFLMYIHQEAVLGKWAERYGHEFPIRMDFLDTHDGGNLSVQVHPRPEYIRKHFGQSFTQDETYYILDCEPDAKVYLGFQEGVDKEEFRNALETSQRERRAIDIERYVSVVQAHKHDLFLIPHGTIHGSGANNLVLEISATTYIFTFKMYDWMRLDLDGKPRPINIERGMENVYFYRQGKRVMDELVSKPSILEQGDDYQIVHLPTHPAHFYDIHRIDFYGEVDLVTSGSCNVMSLVEGDSVILETEGGYRTLFNYAETFVIPADANRYRLISPEGNNLKVLRVFFKENWEENDWLEQIEGIDS